jgi:hypothetical protein
LFSAIQTNSSSCHETQLFFFKESSSIKVAWI